MIQPLINPLSSPYQALIQTLPKSFLTVVQWDVSKPRKKKSKTQSKPKLEKSKRKKTTKMNTHAKKENKTTNKHKKSKTKAKHKHQKKYFKSHSHTLIQPLIKPLSSPYPALIQTLPKSFLTVVQWDVSKPRKKKSKTQSKPKLEKSKRKKTTKMNTHAKKEKKNNK